jgi:hypothetical protein
MIGTEINDNLPRMVEIKPRCAPDQGRIEAKNYLFDRFPVKITAFGCGCARLTI